MSTQDEIRPSPSTPLKRPQYELLALSTAVVIGLVVISRFNYLLFHGLVELISIAVAWSVFMLAWNAQRHIQHNLLLLLGISALFVGILDLVHTLAYRGMGVFPGYDADLPTQLWIAARYLQAGSVLAAVGIEVLGRGRVLDERRGAFVFAGYAAVTAALMAIIFAGAFPACYVEGVGLTPFKRISEYVISAALLAAGVLLWRGAGRLARPTRKLLMAFIIASVGAELTFTLYVDVYGTFGVIGHLLKVIAFLFLYQAIVRTGIREPYAFLSRDLQASEARLQSIFRVVPTGIGLVHDRVFWEVNPRVCEMTGYEAHELVGSSARILYPTQADYDFVGDEKYRQIAADGTGAVETRWQRKDGTIIDVLLASTPLDPDDLDQGVIFTALDITERVRLLAAVKAQARRLQEILDAVPEGVVLLDADHRVLLANPLATQELPRIATVQEDDRLVKLGVRALSELLSSPPAEFWHEVQAAGRTFEVISRRISSGEAPDLFLLVFKDVTGEREREFELRQQERLAAVGQLAAGIAHDFNNILAVIVLYAQMDLQVGDLPGRYRQHLATILQEAQHAANLVQQILDFGRRAMLAPTAMDLVPFLTDHLALLSRTLPENIQISLETGADAAWVAADVTRLRQLITNLAVNARDAMPEGGELVIAVAPFTLAADAPPPLPDMPAGEWVRLVVADTGAGIPADVMAHLFEPFFTTKPPGQGSGLGLPQVYGIVKQHRGYIDVETQVGKGSTFIIYLPALADAPMTVDPPATLSLRRGDGERVLVVEDDDPLREAVVGSLKLLGYRVLEAANGRAALELILEHIDAREGADPPKGAESEVAYGIDLVLSDLVMPDMGGEALFRAVRARGVRLPFVMLTGHPLDHELDVLLKEGLSAWLHKPVQIEQLAEALAQALAATRS